MEIYVFIGDHYNYSNEDIEKGQTKNDMYSDKNGVSEN